MILVFFILLNFFLAIVVDSFTKVKEEVQAMARNAGRRREPSAGVRRERPKDAL